MAQGNNNKLPARSYSKEFKELLKVVFQNYAVFGDFFGGGIEALDGIQHKDTAFSVKTSDIPVVVGNEYIKDADVAFGEGTGKSTRFGERTEIIYTDTDVPYTWEWLMHEGIDRHTVNNDLETAVADRLELQARAKTNAFNTHHSAFISGAAAKTVGITAVNKDKVMEVLSKLHKHFVNAQVVGTPVAKVTPDFYNAIIDADLMVTAKGSSVNIDREYVNMAKGFVIEEVADAYFQENECAYAYVPAVGKAFTGIETARTIESEDFDGIALQGAGKAGEFILPDNKLAVAKVVIGGKDNDPLANTGA